MSGSLVLSGSSRFCLGVLVLAFMSPTIADAKVHLIAFGGTVGFAYSPASLSVAIGDTVRWTGSFEFHPFRSTSVPAGAASFENSSGTTFDYVVPVAGSYAYACDVHAPGMSGSFTAAVAGVGQGTPESQPADYQLKQNYPNPFNPSTTIAYSIPGAAFVSMKVFNLLGMEVATLVNGLQDGGNHRITWNASGVTSGVYLYTLKAGEYTQTRSMVLLR